MIIKSSAAYSVNRTAGSANGTGTLLGRPSLYSGYEHAAWEARLHPRHHNMGNSEAKDAREFVIASPWLAIGLTCVLSFLVFLMLSGQTCPKVVAAILTAMLSLVTLYLMLTNFGTDRIVYE